MVWFSHQSYDLPGEYDRVQMSACFKENSLWSVTLNLTKLLMIRNKIIFT